jgi:hypothetical protein
MIKLELIKKKSITPLSKDFSIMIKLSLLKQGEKFKSDAIIFVSFFYSPLNAWENLAFLIKYL